MNGAKSLGDDTVSNLVVAPCNDCTRDTRHLIVHTVAPSNSHKYETLQCRGCDRISFKETQEYENMEPTIQYYPPPISRRRPMWSQLMSFIYSEETRRFEDLLEEIYAATQNGLPRLSLMGIRAVFEQMMIIKVGDNGNFSKNLTSFADAGYISVKQHDTIQKILDARHAVTHRDDFRPTKEDLNIALDVMEGIQAAIYVHDEEANRVSRKIPMRQKAKKTS